MTSKIRNFNEYLNESDNGLTSEQEKYLTKCVRGTWKMNNGKVDVIGSVSANFAEYEHFPVQFGTVTESFDCQENRELVDLVGAPHTVRKNFSCVLCTRLTNLKGSPKYVGNNFDCAGCHGLKDLEGAPEEVGGEFRCRRCSKLTSLKGAPKQVGEKFDCSGDTSLESLYGMPYNVPYMEIYSCPNIHADEREEFFKTGSIGGERVNAHNLEELRRWLKSGLTLEEYKTKHRGRLSSKNIFGFMK